MRNAVVETTETQSAARTIQRQLLILRVQAERDIEAAYATLAQQRTDALVVANDGFFLAHAQQLVAMSAPKFSWENVQPPGRHQPLKFLSSHPRVPDDSRDRALDGGRQEVQPLRPPEPFPVVSIQNNAALSQGPADASPASWRCVKASARAVAFSYYDRPRWEGENLDMRGSNSSSYFGGVAVWPLTDGA